MSIGSLMNFDFSGRVAIVTGGAGGIGSATVLRLLQSGAKVAAFDRDQGRLDQLKTGKGNDLSIHLVDVMNLEQVERAVAEVERAFGRIDILISVAGGGTPTTIQSADANDWNRVIALNLSAPFFCIKAVAPAMRRVGGGSIVTVGSLAAFQMSFNNGASYTAAKSGVLGLTRHAAFELSRDNIRVNAVLPGPIMTPQMDAKIDAKSRAAVPKQVPLGRWLAPDEVADPILFFCSEAARGCTGSHVLVDGGLHIGAQYDRETYFAKRGE
jgi:3-oxoacyl-[acyl-carrier protein] reductase